MEKGLAINSLELCAAHVLRLIERLGPCILKWMFNQRVDLCPSTGTEYDALERCPQQIQPI